MLIAQLTDCHVVERGALFDDRIDTAAGLARAIEHLHRMTPRPDLVVATGDLVNDGAAAEYDHLEALLSVLEIPLMVVPGNHDDRTELRHRFGAPLPPGGPDDPLHYVVDQYPVRVVALDTTVPEEPGGRLGPAQLDWLDDQLGSAPDRPTLIVQHHPPFVTGIEWMDAVGLADADDEARVVAQHRHVLAVVCGHVHRPIVTEFAGTVASCWPSTGAQVALALDGTPFGYVDEPPAVAIHRWRAGQGLTSHVSLVGPHARWLPAWATRP